MLRLHVLRTKTFAFFYSYYLLSLAATATSLDGVIMPRAREKRDGWACQRFPKKCKNYFICHVT
jgi:hypothetical protein